jgi:uncharacterized RDD family membrane protein YckC
MSTKDFDHTDLIDVGDIEAPLAEDVTSPDDDISFSGNILERRHSEEPEGPAIADIRDRFAAFAIDLMFLYIIYWPMMLAYRSIAFGNTAGPIPASGKPGIIFHGLFLFMALVWFVIPEMAFGASIGKLLCGLSVRGKDGGYPSLIPVLLRNILRPVDIMLFPILILPAAMELTAWHKRVGDMLAGTLVVKRSQKFRRQYALSLDIIASATARAIAFMIDLFFIAGFVLGYAMLLSPAKPLESMLMLVMFPPVITIFFVIEEWLFKTSPGKWIIGLVICNEDGAVVDLSGAFIRTIWRPFDMNPFGFLVAMLSLRHQRPGDSAANTVVIKTKREVKGALALLFWLTLALGFLYAGVTNSDNFMSSGFKVNFLPAIDFSNSKTTGKSMTPLSIIIKDFSFAEGEGKTPRKPSIYQPGEMVYILFDIDGYAMKGDQVWIQEDLTINYPDGSVGLKLENINDFNQELENLGTIRFENNIQLPANAEPGRYTVLVTLRDRVANSEIKEQRFFYVTPSDVSEKQPQAAPSYSKPDEELPIEDKPSMENPSEFRSYDDDEDDGEKDDENEDESPRNFD